MEWILIAVVVLLFFGGRKIPGLMRGIGRGMKEFNDGSTKTKKDANTSEEENEEAPLTSKPTSKEN